MAEFGNIEGKPCLDDSLASLTLGTLCVGCTAECQAYNSGQRNLRLITENNELRAENQELRGQLELANKLLEMVIVDKVIPGFYGPEALTVFLYKNPELVREVLELEWGILDGDIRGLKDANDRFDKPVANGLLCVAGKRMTMLRGRDEPIIRERRILWDIGVHDVPFRPTGSDEMAMLVRRIVATFPPVFQGRAQARFSVRQAIEDDRQGKIPVIANFTTAHASEFRNILPPEMPTDRYEEAKLALSVLEAVYQKVDAQSTIGKREQYDEMWEMVVQGRPQTLRASMIKPKDHRDIAAQFLEIYCPNYYRNQREMLINWEQYV